MTGRIVIEKSFRTLHGVYRLRAKVTPGSDMAAQVLRHITWLEKQHELFRTAKTRLVAQ